MFIVVEVQKSADDKIATLVTSFDERNDAESKYHNILSYAAVSTLPKHGAIILSDDCVPVLYKSYTHE
jgi:hypothetical protein